MALADLKLTTLDRLNIALAESDPEDAEFLISVASEVIKNELNRGIEKKERQEDYEGNSGRRLYLNSWPIDEILEVEINGETITDYKVNKKRGYLERSSGWRNSETTITIKYVGGFVLPGDENRDLPQPLEMACILLVQNLYNNQLADMRVQRETRGGLSKTYFSADDLPRVPKTIKLLIAKYKRQLV